MNLSILQQQRECTRSTRQIADIDLIGEVHSFAIKLLADHEESLYKRLTDKNNIPTVIICHRLDKRVVQLVLGMSTVNLMVLFLTLHFIHLWIETRN